MRMTPESAHSAKAHAQYDLAKCYENGFGVRKNMSEAVRCYSSSD